MSIIELGALGEFASSVLVLATLGYLAVQVRQNTKSTNTANYVNAAEMFNQINSVILADERAHEIFVRGHNNPESLADEEATRYLISLRAYNNAFMALYWSHQDGTFPEEAWTIYKNNFAALLNTPGGSRLIDSFRSETPAWADYLSSIRDEFGRDMRWVEQGFQELDS